MKKDNLLTCLKPQVKIVPMKHLPHLWQVFIQDEVPDGRVEVEVGDEQVDSVVFHGEREGRRDDGGKSLAVVWVEIQLGSPKCPPKYSRGSFSV